MSARSLLVSLFVSVLALPVLAAGNGRSIEEAGATVLCYHIVESPQDPRMEISRETFIQQMHYLQLTGYNVIPLRDLYDYVMGKKPSLPKNAVVITIDDGWRSTYTEVFPAMKKMRFPFTVFIYPKIIGQTAYALTWKQVKEMAEAGVDIQSHSFSHPFLTRRRHGSLDDHSYAAWLQRELVESRNILAKETGKPVQFLAYPYGDYDHYLADAVARAGYTAALTCDFGRVRKGSDPLRMKRVVIDKKMDFAAFRRYMGAGQMPIERISPPPNQVVDPAQPVLQAKLPNYRNIDPSTIGMALLSAGGTNVPYRYDPKDGSITLMLRDVANTIKGKYQRALIWATDSHGKRVEASMTFKLLDPAAPKPADAVPAQQKPEEQATPVAIPSQAGSPAAPAAPVDPAHAGVPKG